MQLFFRVSLILIVLTVLSAIMPIAQAMELETIPDVFVYGKDGTLVAQNRRNSPLPAIILLVKYNDRNSWENSNSLLATSINDITIASLSISNGTTWMSDILLNHEDEYALLNSGEEGYYKIITCWGNFSDVPFISDDIPSDIFLGDWKTKFLNYARSKDMTVEHFLKYTSTLTNTFGSLATAAANVSSYGVGTVG